MKTNKEWLELYKEHAEELGTYPRRQVPEVRIVNKTDDFRRKYELVDYVEVKEKKVPFFKRIGRGAKKVLKAVVRSPIFGLAIQLSPKPARIMLTWLKNRFKEPSTYQGLAALAGAIGVSISPDLWQAISSLAVSIIGLIQIIKKERNESEASPKE